MVTIANGKAIIVIYLQNTMKYHHEKDINIIGDYYMYDKEGKLHMNNI